MSRVMIAVLVGLCLVAAACNKGDGTDDSASKVPDTTAAVPTADSPEVMSAAMTDEEPPQPEQDFSLLTDDEREFVMHVRSLLMEQSIEYGLIVDDEEEHLVKLDGSMEPVALAGLVEKVRETMASGDGTGRGMHVRDPMEAVRYVMDVTFRPDMPVASSTMPPGMEPPPETPMEPEAMMESVDAGEAELVEEVRANTREMVISLAAHYGLTYVEEQAALTGEGFPAEGVAVDTVVSKIEVTLRQRGGNRAKVEPEVRAALSQLAEAGRQIAGKQDTAPRGDSKKQPAPPSGGKGGHDLNYYPTPDELLHPEVVYGDWQSLREDLPRYTLDHDAENFEMIQFRYQDNAVFELIRDSEQASRTEFPYRYDPRSGEVSLIGADGKPLQTMTVWATEKDPLLIWVQKEGSKIKTLYEKKGRAGEPTTLEDEVEGVRLMLGEEEAEAYRRREEAKGRR